MSAMFDRSHLAPTEFEFVVVSDTHFILDPEPYVVEFDSVREWSQRATWSLKLAAALDGDFVIHLGDPGVGKKGQSSSGSACQGNPAGSCRQSERP